MIISCRISASRALALSLALGSCLLAFADSLSAQGALSAQGFGYPTGGFSARALGTGGATAEFDMLSSRNPAAASEIGNGIISIQGEPEFRTLRFGESIERSTLQRVPLVAAGLRVRGVGILLSGSTFLDRSYNTEAAGQALIEGQLVPTNDRFETRGAMTELRMSAGWNWKNLSLGTAIVAVTGQHTVARTRTFPDSLQFGFVLDSARVGFEGLGLALGANWRVNKDLFIGASWRSSGPLNALQADSVISKANLPSRVGAGVLYQGIPGSVFAASIERVGWSAMNGLGSSASVAQDALNWSAGLEVIGGRLRRAPILWRAGYAQRDLPFLSREQPVSERAFFGGLGLPIASDVASLDIAVQRSLRRVADNVATENAWGLTFGLTIRP